MEWEEKDKEKRGKAETSIIDAGVELDDDGASSDRLEEVGRRLHRASAGASLLSSASAPLLSSSAHSTLNLKLEMACVLHFCYSSPVIFVDYKFTINKSSSSSTPNLLLFLLLIPKEIKEIRKIEKSI
jgi:hypothetical protein